MTPRSRICRERLEDDVDDLRREAERRLVEEEEVRPRDERARDRELLLLAAGERAGRRAAELGDDREELVHPGDVRVDARRGCAARRSRGAGSPRR